MDTGSSESYVDDRLLKGLKLSLEREPSTIVNTMASTLHSVQVEGAILVNLKVFNNNYPKFKLGVMKELCADVILEIDFMKLHSEIEFKMHGPQEAISVNSPLNNPCNVMAAKIEPPEFFDLPVFPQIVFLSRLNVDSIVNLTRNSLKKKFQDFLKKASSNHLILHGAHKYLLLKRKIVKSVW